MFVEAEDSIGSEEKQQATVFIANFFSLGSVSFDNNSLDYSYVSFNKQQFGFGPILLILYR
jgi:hypothetical protein